MQRMDPSSPGRQFHHWGALAGAGYVVLFAAWLFWGRKDPLERFLVGDVSVLISVTIAAALSIWVRHFQKSNRLRLIWSLFSLGFSFWTMAAFGRLVAQAGQPDWILTSRWPELVYLAGTIPVWAGLLLYPRPQRSQAAHLVLLLDVTVVTAAVVTLVWLIIFKPAFTILPAVSRLLALVFPTADLLTLLLILNLFMLTNASLMPTPLGWILLGILASSVGNLAYTHRMLTTGYSSGTWIDLSWVFGNTLLSIGMLAAARIADHSDNIHPLKGMASLLRFLPLLSILALGAYSLLRWRLIGQLETTGMWVTVLMTIVLTARQGMLAGELELEKYANLVNSIAEPAFVCDRQGRLRLVNPALLKSAGYAVTADVLGHDLSQIIHPAAEINRILPLGLSQGWSGELSLCRKDGVLIPVSLSLRPLLPGGDRRLVLAGTAHDLSGQKKQEAALRAAYDQIAADREQLEALNQSLEQLVAEKTADLTLALRQLEDQNLALHQLDQLKSDFVSLVSHELRAPLTTINSGIELLLARPDPLPDRARGNLELVQSEIRRLSRFVETILDLSALDAGRLPLYPAPLLLESVMLALRHQLTGREAFDRVSWQTASVVRPLLADEQAITSVLYHLVDNALKYAPFGQVIITAAQDGDRVCICVLDDGPGIPPDALSLVFERFYRVDTADSQTIYGRGLGLYIVRRLITAMHGEIQATNRPEGGACFTLWLPAA